ncbi:MAG: GTP cyclohydrolase FolE2 [Pseudomonadales bacterium]
MNKPLPDVALSALDETYADLSWVGMQGIAAPIKLDSQGQASAGQVAIGVDLPGGEGARRGIHMSRLYKLLDKLGAEPLSGALLRQILQGAIGSHEDCRSRSAELEVSFDLLLARGALLSEGQGWQRYPVTVRSRMTASNELALELEVQVKYSSTCPCSAALSREALAEAFAEGVCEQERFSAAQVAQWLSAHGSIATPHSQRSTATVSVSLSESGLLSSAAAALIEDVEQALQTAVQTFVKRSDEQAFALRNGANLMYVEDAVRRLTQALTSYRGARVKVRHAESLHAHDAVAMS